MSDSLLFVPLAHTNEANTPIFHESIKSFKEEPILSKPVQTTNTDKNPLSSLEPDWYQNDLSHMTTNLMKNAINTTTALNPNIMLASASFNEDVYGGYNPGIFNDGSSLGSIGIPNPHQGQTDHYDPKEEERKYQTPHINDIYRDVLGRSPSDKELQDGFHTIIKKNHSWKYVRDQLAHSQIGHDHYAEIARGVMGYDVDENIIKGMQERASKEGNNTFDIQKDLANSQETHDRYVSMSRDMLGHNADENAIHDMQNQAANGSKYNDIKYNLAHSSQVNNALLEMGSSISGVDLRNTDYGQAWGKSVQDKLGDPNAHYSLDQERYNYSHSGFVYDQYANMARNMLGHDADENAIHDMQNQAGNGKNYQDVKNSFVNLSDADEVTDLLNNEIARKIGAQYSTKQTMKVIAIRMLDEFYTNGLYTIQQTSNGNFQVVKTKITKEQYDFMKSEYNKRNDIGKKS